MAASSSATGASFLLVFRNAGPDTHAHLTAEQKVAVSRQWNDWVESLSTKGKFHQGAPLALEGRVVVGAPGRVVDGPYAEGKEVIGGYVFLTATDLDEAVELAKGCPGLAQGLIVEVRPVAAFSPVLEEVKARPAG